MTRDVIGLAICNGVLGALIGYLVGYVVGFRGGALHTREMLIPKAPKR
jgi:membrane protein DedA with SNARE-associated domain